MYPALINVCYMYAQTNSNNIWDSSNRDTNIIRKNAMLKKEH